MKPKLVVDNPTPAKIAAPASLGKVGKDTWSKTAPLLSEGGIIPAGTEQLLLLYCMAVESAHDCAKELKKGRTIKTPQGLKAHPLVRAEAVALQNSLKYAEKLGLVAKAKPLKPNAGLAPSLVD